MPFVLYEGWKDSHSSSLTGDELKALANKIIDIPGLKKPDASAHDFWKHVSNQIQTRDVGITKGIHEKNRLHFNIFIESPKDLRWEKTVEVFVRREGPPTTVTSQPFIGKGIHNGKTTQLNLYAYEVRGLSAMINNVQQNFPAQFFFGLHAVDLRLSLSIGNSTTRPAVRNDFKEPAPVKKGAGKK